MHMLKRFVLFDMASFMAACSQVFDGNEVHIIDPTNSERVHHINKAALCSGSWSGPVQIGEHVLAVCQADSECEN